MSITIQVAIVDTLSAMSVTDWMPTRSASGLMVGTEAFATVYTLFNISQANCLTTVCTRLYQSDRPIRHSCNIPKDAPDRTCVRTPHKHLE